MTFWKVLLIFFLFERAFGIFCNKNFSVYRQYYRDVMAEGHGVFLSLDYLAVGNFSTRSVLRQKFQTKLRVPPAFIQKETKLKMFKLKVYSETGTYMKGSYKLASHFKLDTPIRDISSVFIYESDENHKPETFFLNSCLMIQSHEKSYKSQKVFLVLNDGKMMIESEILSQISKTSKYQHFDLEEFDDKIVSNCDDMVFYMNECETSNISDVFFVISLYFFCIVIGILVIIIKAFRNLDLLKNVFSRCRKKTPAWQISWEKRVLT